MSKLETIALEALEDVTGGKTKLPVSTGISGGTDSNSAVLASLQGIQSSLSDLGKNNNNGNSNAFLFMGLAMAMQRRNETVVYGGPRGYYWRSSW